MPEPVLVAGAGPVGLAAALELAGREHPVRIIEREPSRPPLSKAIGVNARTMELLERSGVTERLLARGRRVPGATLYDGERRLARIEFGELAHRYNFMLALPQHETESVLEARLSELGVGVERGVALTTFEQDEHGVRCSLAGGAGDESFTASHLIGADGAHSTTRKALGLDFPGETMSGDWSLADVRMTTPFDGDTACVVFSADRMVFMIRIRDDHFRVASQRPNVLDALPQGCAVEEVIWESDFTVSHRQVPTYAVGRVFLAGDAAHIHSPLGARGMNLGVEDAFVLARMIADGDTGAYSEERHRVGAATVRMVRAQTALATGTGSARRLARRTLLPAALSVRPLRRRLVARMLGVG